MVKKKFKIAFLYNIRHSYPNPNDSRTQLETDFDDPKTIKFIIKHLRNCGYEIYPIEANEMAYLKLYRLRKKIDLAFNFAEGIYGRDRECHLPAMLEMLQIPYTGSTPLTQAIVLDKAKTKEILIMNGVPTLPFQIFKTGKEELNPSLTYPLIVKPIAQGSGAGITNDSVVNNIDDLYRKINHMIKTFNHAAIVEPFLTGQEFTVAMIGNPPKILPIISPDHSKLPKGYLPMDSLEVKWVFEEAEDKKGAWEYLICPAKMNQSLQNKIEKIAYDLWYALEIRDWCRIDIRCDIKNNPYVLEVNSPPGIMPPEASMTSSFPLSARTAGINYENLLKLIVSTALKRYNL
jgi:D-alanine-D-alanine ligase